MSEKKQEKAEKKKERNEKNAKKKAEEKMKREEVKLAKASKKDDYREALVNKTLPQNPHEHWAEGLLKVWPHFCWNIRDKIHKNNLMKLSVQPGFLTIHRKLRVIIRWCSGLGSAT